MKIYSEVLDKMFDSIDDCKEAEEKFRVEQEEKEKNEKEESLKISKEKKSMSMIIEEADKNLNKAYDEYEIAKDKVKDIFKESEEKIKTIVEEYNDKALDILNPAKEAIKKAQEDKFNAVSEFNKKFGTYTIRYTGDKAYNEYRRISNWVNDFFNKDIFNRFFW